jgi:uncharacterized protein (DUF1015 family)
MSNVNLKLGDKLLCIKTYTSLYRGELYFKNKIYAVTDISYNEYIYENSYEINDTFWFCFDENSIYNIEEFFISLKEQRKQKLLKLKKS